MGCNTTPVFRSKWILEHLLALSGELGRSLKYLLAVSSLLHPLIKGRHADSEMYSGRVPLWSVWTLLVCFRRDRANHSIRYDRHRTQKEGAERTHVPGSHSGSLRGLYTSYLHHLRTDDERSGDRNAAHRRICRCYEFDGRSDCCSMFLTTCRGCSVYHVWWH